MRTAVAAEQLTEEAPQQQEAEEPAVHGPGAQESPASKGKEKEVTSVTVSGGIARRALTGSCVSVGMAGCCHVFPEWVAVRSSAAACAALPGFWGGMHATW